MIDLSLANSNMKQFLAFVSVQHVQIDAIRPRWQHLISVILLNLNLVESNSGKERERGKVNDAFIEHSSSTIHVITNFRTAGYTKSLKI